MANLNISLGFIPKKSLQSSMKLWWFSTF